MGDHVHAKLPLTDLDFSTFAAWMMVAFCLHVPIKTSHAWKFDPTLAAFMAHMLVVFSHLFLSHVVKRFGID